MSSNTYRNPMAGDSTRKQSIVTEAGKQYINIASMPLEIQEHVKVFDRNGDGLIATDELVDMSNAHNALNQSNQLFKRMLQALVAIMFVSVLVVFGLSFAVYELSKESTVGDDAVMRHVGDHKVVQTGNADMMVSGTQLTTRDNGAPVATTDAATTYDASEIASSAPDEFFDDLTALKFKHGGSSASLKIKGFTRKPADDETNTDTITFLTSAGDVTLNGPGEWGFDESAGTYLTNAGFPLEAATGRRLQFAFAAAIAGVALVVGAGTYGVVGCAAGSAHACSLGSAVLTAAMG